MNRIAQETADTIEANGHYQSQSDGAGGRSCIVINNLAWRTADSDEQDEFLLALSEKAGITERDYLSDGGEIADLISIYRWNDNTPTAEVVATLRSL